MASYHFYPTADQQQDESHYQHRYVFFRELTDDSIGIMSLLHESMNMPVHLKHDLEKLDHSF